VLTIKIKKEVETNLRLFVSNLKIIKRNKVLWVLSLAYPAIKSYKFRVNCLYLNKRH